MGESRYYLGVRGAQIAGITEERKTAPAETKPLLDILGLWLQHGNAAIPLTDSDYAFETEQLLQRWAVNKGLPLSLYLPGKSPITPAEAQAEASSIIDRGLSLVTVLNSIGIVAEIASLGQVESVIWGITNILNTSGLPGIVGDLYRTPMDIGVKIPLERRMNSIYQPQIPDPQALTELRARGVLEEPAYNFWMAEHGFPDWASEMMAYAKTRMPGFSDLLSLFQRGFISSETFRLWLRRSGLHPDTVGPLEQLRWQLPGYQDIISIYMREGYLEEKWVEIPTEFLTYLQQLGYNSEWAKRLWGKHWVLPGVNLLYDMFHKGIIDYDTMVKMLKYHDFEPVWRDRLIANAYNMIPRVDIRRAYRYGMISAAGLTQRYSWLGFNPQDAEIMAGIAQRTSLDRYYARLETVARSAYRKGRIDERMLRIILHQVNTPEEAISLIVRAEDLAKEAAVLEPGEEPRTFTASQILRFASLGIITPAEAHSRLMAMGYTAADATLLLAPEPPKPEPMEINRDLITAASTLYRQGLMDPSAFQGYLRKAGLSENDIAKKVDAEDLRYRYDYLTDLITLARTAYQKDIYTAEELEASLLTYGMQPERVNALVALEQLRKLPKPKVAS